MITSNQLSPGVTIAVDEKIYRVESCVKVTLAKGASFIKSRLKDLMSEEVVEKNFKLGTSLQEVALTERGLEFLYMEGKDYLFLDVGTLEQVIVSGRVIGDKVNYLKEGVGIRAMFYGDSIFSVELPQFLELMVVKTEAGSQGQGEGQVAPMAQVGTQATKVAILETGAKIEVPPFIEVGDIIKVDTHTSEYVQRI